MCSSSHHPLIPQQLLSMAALRTFRSAFTCTDIEVSTSSNAAESPSVRLCQFPHVPGHHSIRNVFVGCRMFRGRGPELPFRRFAQTAKQKLGVHGLATFRSSLEAVLHNKQQVSFTHSSSSSTGLRPALPRPHRSHRRRDANQICICMF